MSRAIQHPEQSQDDSALGGTVERHPAYAQIGAQRVSGRAVLYGSDFHHQHYITIRICESKLHRSLSRDWHFAGREYIEVALSEAQWATFVSSLNIGGGVPCTLQGKDLQMIPAIPAPPVRDEQFASDVSEKMQAALRGLQQVGEKIAASSLSKKAQEELQRSLHAVAAHIGGNLDFVAKSFGEHMETVKESAKVEIEAHMHATIQRAGLAALAGEFPITLPSAGLAAGTPEASDPPSPEGADK